MNVGQVLLVLICAGVRYEVRRGQIGTLFVQEAESITGMGEGALGSHEAFCARDRRNRAMAMHPHGVHVQVIGGGG